MEALPYIFLTVFLLVGSPASSVSGEKIPGRWLPTTATWYGPSEGDGSTGGACGYGPLVDMKPFRKRVTAVSDVMFKNGTGCGACYKLMCLYEDICSSRPATVIVTDECPNGGPCAGGNTHFDLSGAAMGKMAKKGMGGKLRDKGLLDKSMVRYIRVKCGYRGRKITFRISEGSSPDWLSLLVTFVNGAGTIESMSIKDQSGTCHEMYQLWGAIYAVNTPGKGPFSVMITSNNKTIEADKVIPSNWSLGESYSSDVNF